MFSDGGFEIGRVEVMDPQRRSVGLGLNPFVVYSIRTEALSGAVVQRRYNDFLWLFEAFVYQFPGAIVPHIPEKQAFKRFEDDFVDARRKKLEVFINRVCAHKLLARSPYLEVFLVANDAKLAGEKSKEKGARHTTTLVWLGQQVGVAAGDLVNYDVDVRDEADQRFLKTHARVRKLHEYAKQLADAAVLLVKSAANSSLALSQAGTGLSAWSREDEDEGLSARLGAAGTSFAALSVEVGRFAQLQMEALEDPLLDCVALLAGAVAAFDRRELSRIEHLRRRRDALAFADGKGASLLTSRKESMGKAAASEESARVRLEAVSNMLASEYSEFERVRIPEIMNIIFSFSRIQADYYTKLHRASAEFMEKLL